MVHLLSNLDYKTLSVNNTPPEFWEGCPDVKGAVVFIKPNLVSPKTKWDKYSQTHVKVTEMVIEKLLSFNPKKIIVGECGFKNQWDSTLLSTRYYKLKKYPKVEIIPLQDGENFHKFTLKRLENYRSLFGVKFSNYLLESDFIINVPKMKVHTMAVMTGAIKNMMGTMTQKGSMHPKASIPILHQRLADLYQLTSKMVNFIVMDGIVGAEYSEQCGLPVNSGILLSGIDQWEVDVAAAKLMGINPKDVPYLGFIRKDFEKVKVPHSLVIPYELTLKYRSI